MNALTSGFRDFAGLAAAVAQNPIREIDATRRVWIFGAGNFGRSLCKAMQSRGIEVAGFVETVPRVASALDLPILDWAALARCDGMAQLALGIFNRATPFDELVALSGRAGLPPPLMPWDTYDAFEKEMGWRFWLSRREFLVSHLKRIAKVADRLADEESRATLLRICAFRLGLDLAFASHHSSDHQYFNALTLAPLIGKSIGYVDCGAYTGDTYVELASQPGIHCKQAFLLEPDPANYTALSKNVAQRPEAICLPLAAAGEYTILSFASGQGEGGAIAAGGDIRIAAVALDQMLPDGDVHFIKIDVEGAEAQVLRGAAGLIHNRRPTLALSLYHNPQDLFELPELLFELCDDYRFYVRQHYCNTFECVLYACPAAR